MVGRSGEGRAPAPRVQRHRTDPDSPQPRPLCDALIRLDAALDDLWSTAGTLSLAAYDSTRP